ncbi:MAG: helix-turn-helix domain-containing protein [Cellvibrionaceae bacterium]
MTEYQSYADRWVAQFEERQRAGFDTCDLGAQYDEFGLPLSRKTTAPQFHMSDPGSRDVSPEKVAYVCPVVQSAIQLRNELGFTQARFAKCLNISPRTLRDWERGRRQPSASAMTLLAWAIDRPDYVEEINRSKKKQVKLRRLIVGH